VEAQQEGEDKDDTQDHPNNDDENNFNNNNIKEAMAQTMFVTNLPAATTAH